MKKISAFTLAFLLFAGALQSQITYGVKLGANISTVAGEDYDHDDKKSKLGLQFGGLVNIPVQEKFSVQPELLYSQEGAMWKDSDYSEKEAHSFLNIPVLAQYDDPSGFFAHTGPQIGLLLGVKEKYKDDEENESRDIKDEFKSTAFSWVIGAGFRHSSNIGIGARYSLGLSDIGDGWDNSAKHRGFNVYVFYVFGR